MIICCYVGYLQVPEKVNDTWRKTVPRGMMDRGFTVFVQLLKHNCFQPLILLLTVKFQFHAVAAF